LPSAVPEETHVKSFDLSKMAGWAIAAGVGGSFVSTAIGVAFTGMEPSDSVNYWMSLWWAWVPAGLLIGFLMSRKSA
jgi:hypothetical protein